MCGLLGWAGTLTAQDLRPLMRAATDRGHDSWSVVGVDHDGETREWRGLGPLWSKRRGPRRARLLASLTIASVHTRHATQGRVTLENAHNFAVKDGDQRIWHASHNGMIWSAPHGPECDSLSILRPWVQGRHDISESGYGVIARILPDPATPMLEVAPVHDGELVIGSTDDATIYASTDRGMPPLRTTYITEDGATYEIRVDAPYVTASAPLVRLTGLDYRGPRWSWDDYGGADVATVTPASTSRREKAWALAASPIEAAAYLAWDALARGDRMYAALMLDGQILIHTEPYPDPDALLAYGPDCMSDYGVRYQGWVYRTWHDSGALYDAVNGLWESVSE